MKFLTTSFEKKITSCESLNVYDDSLMVHKSQLKRLQQWAEFSNSVLNNMDKYSDLSPLVKGLIIYPED